MSLPSRSRNCLIGTTIVMAVAAVPVAAEIIGGSHLALDLTDSQQGPKKAKWNDAGHIAISAEGLGWGTRQDKGSRDLSLQTTEPVALGESWRPPFVATIRAAVERPGDAGVLYARFSADGKHWTTWQPLEEEAAAAGADRARYRGTLRVPYRERARYETLRLDYARRTDVAWASDEEALAQEIHRRDPTFFAKNPPFIGYVQLLYEAQLPAGRRIKSLNAEVLWTVSGLHTPPKTDKASKDRSGPWRWQAP